MQNAKPAPYMDLVTFMTHFINAQNDIFTNSSSWIGVKNRGLSYRECIERAKYYWVLEYFPQDISSMFGCDDQELQEMQKWFTKYASYLSDSASILFKEFLRAKSDQNIEAKNFLKMIQPVGDLYAPMPAEYHCDSKKSDIQCATVLFFIEMIRCGKIKDQKLISNILHECRELLTIRFSTNIANQYRTLIAPYAEKAL